MKQVPHIIEHLSFNATFLAFDLFAVFMFASSGALAAIRKRYDFIGVLILAFVSGLGGGLIRDAIFIQASPPKAVIDSNYMIVVLVAFVLSMLFHGRLDRLRRTTLIVDALGLGAYGVVGCQAALQAHLVPLAAILVGTFNAIGAGLIRDVLIREEPIIFKPGQFYAGAAILGCSIFVVLTVFSPLGETSVALIATVTATTMRLLAVRFNWQTRAILEDNITSTPES